MRSIAVINQKGGVGKTTTTVNLAAAIAAAGKTVLAIDLDPQAHLTINFGVQPKPDNGVYALVTESATAAGSLMKVRRNLWLIPSNINLAAAEIELVSVVGREVILRDALANLDREFDYLLIDCPPSLGLLTINALAAVNEVFIPLQPHFLALQGLGMLLDETVRLVAKRVNPDLRVTGIILTMYEAGTRLASEVVDDVRGYFHACRDGDSPWAKARVFDAIIRRNIKLAEAPSHGLTIFDYEPRSNGALDYARLAAEITGDSITVDAITERDAPAESDANPSHPPPGAAASADHDAGGKPIKLPQENADAHDPPSSDVANIA